MDIHARLKIARIAPRKLRLVANALRGLSAQEADTQLTYLAPRGAGILQKVLRSAMANAKHNFAVEPSTLIVREVIVGSGTTMKRIMARARGSAYRIEKRTSRVDVVLTEKMPSGQERKGKTSELVTRTVQELSAEDLHQGHDVVHDHAHGSEPKPSGSAVKSTDIKGARPSVERRTGGGT